MHDTLYQISNIIKRLTLYYSLIFTEFGATINKQQNHKFGAPFQHKYYGSGVRQIIKYAKL